MSKTMPRARRLNVFLLTFMLGLAGCGQGGVEKSGHIEKRSVSYPIDKFLKTLKPGTIVYNKPPTMSYGETRTVQLVLSTKKSATELEGELTAAGAAQHASIQIAPVMEAKLSASEGAFAITAITPETQPISAANETEW
jgi:hypothetical protein